MAPGRLSDKNVDVRASAHDVSPEPWGRRLWLALAAVVLVAGALQSYGISSWPLVDDEVPTLVELGLLDISADAFSVPAGQIGRLPRAMPVWYGFQRIALDILPASEISFRLPSVLCGLLTVAIVFVTAARSRGLPFAGAVSLILLGCVPFILLSQVNRFYSMPLLLMVITLISIWMPRGGSAVAALTAVLATLTVLSHNVTVVVFVLALMAAAPLYLRGRVPGAVVVRSGAAALVSVLLYLFYLRPLVSGWNSTGNPTPVLISLAAHVGVPTLALALLGGWVAVVRREQGVLLWWTLMVAGSIAFLQVASQFTTINWNPRYFFFFMPAFWVLAAYGVDRVAQRIGSRPIAAAWYACVALLLLPSLLSHYRDGSRHDYRAAASVLVAHAERGQPILSDDAETISYYLPEELRGHLIVRTKVRTYPQEEFFLVARSTAWTPSPEFPNRNAELIAEIFRRRFDHFSHILRVYRVKTAEPAETER